MHLLLLSQRKLHILSHPQKVIQWYLSQPKKWRNIQCNLLHLIEEIKKVVVDGSARLELTGRCGTEAGFRVARSITK